MLARLAVFACAVAGILGTLTGCHKKGADPKPTLALVTNAAGFGDRSFNDEAAAGLAECRRETGTQFSTAATSSATEYEPKLALFATQNVEMTVAIGYTMANDVARIARRFENAHFAIIDAVVDEPNVNSVSFKEQDGGLLAGALAALVSRTRRVGFIGGAHSSLLERYEVGFSAGVREIDPHVGVRTRYLGSFEDTRKAAAAANALFSQGVDVVFVVAGRAGLGAIAAVKTRAEQYVIGADSNEDALAPGKVLASAVKRVDRAVLRVCRETAARKTVSGHVALGVAEDAIDLTDAPAARATIGAANRARIERIRRAIATGTLVPPASRAALRTFRPKLIP